MRRPSAHAGWVWVFLIMTVTGSPVSAGPVYSDPVGDTIGMGPVQHDIILVHGDLQSGQLSFTVQFASPIAPPSGGLVNPSDPLLMEAFLDLDTDRNSMTGVASLLLPPLGQGSPIPALGVEFRVDVGAEVFQPGFADLIDTATNTAVPIPIVFTPAGFTVTIPLALLGGTGEVNYGVLAGTLAIEPTDQAANPNQPVFTVTRDTADNPIPEPTSALLLAAGLPFLVRYRRR